MTLDLAILTALAVTSVCTAFVAYWIGVGHAERKARASVEHYRSDAATATALFMAGRDDRLADVLAEPTGPVLRVLRGGA